MTIEEARAVAQEAYDRAAQMGPNHAETARGAALAGVIMDLAAQLETAQHVVGEHEAEKKTAKESKKK